MLNDHCSTKRGQALRAMLIAGLIEVLGCASAPPGPRGPLLGPGVEVATDFSYAYGAGSATLADGTTAGGGADVWGPPLTVIPRRIEGRVSPVAWADIGGEIGWLDGSVDVRMGLPARPDRLLPFNLDVGYESGAHGVLHGGEALRSRWLRLEAYPLLPSNNGAWRLVLAVALHSGTFYHELADPRPYEGFCDTYCRRVIATIRHETRLETSLGLFASSRIASFLFTASPYFVLDAGAPKGAGDGEAPATYHQSWGVVFVARWALGYRW